MVVSKHTDRNNNTQPIRMMSSRWELVDCPLVRGDSNFPNVRTMASITEDLFAPAINDFRPRNVNKINTLKVKCRNPDKCIRNDHTSGNIIC